MPRDYWKPMFTKLFGCLSARDRSRKRPEPNARDRTLGGRVRDKKARKKPRPIPKAFLERFWRRYSVADPLGIPVRQAVKDYYTQELTSGDYNFDASKAKFPESFERQLKAVKYQELSVVERATEISPDTEWRVIQVLSHGSFGTVYLMEWYSIGTTNPIQFALKDTAIDHFWADYCVEGELTRRLNMIGCPNVVKVHDWVKSHEPPRSGGSWDLKRNHYRFRILYDYYDHGDVQDLMDYYIDNDSTANQEAMEKNISILFPESFVWHFIHQITTALLYCAHGQPTGTKKTGWEEIVHKDVKPKNILLGPIPENGGVYPELLLADFGLAYAIPNEDVRAYKKAFPQGTPGFVAPEAEDSRKAGDIGPASDIYSLGKVIEHFVDRVQTLYTEDEFRIASRRSNINLYFPYTYRLLKIREGCLQNSPSERPLVFSLWEESRRKAREAAAVVRENRRVAFEQGKEFYEGMVLLSKETRERLCNDRQLREAFQRETDWLLLNRDRVEEIQNESARRRAERAALYEDKWNKYRK